jgi:hypothetical protein
MSSFCRVAFYKFYRTLEDFSLILIAHFSSFIARNRSIKLIAVDCALTREKEKHARAVCVGDA